MSIMWNACISVHLFTLLIAVNTRYIYIVVWYLHMSWFAYVASMCHMRGTCFRHIFGNMCKEASKLAILFGWFGQVVNSAYAIAYAIRLWHHHHCNWHHHCYQHQHWHHLYSDSHCTIDGSNVICDLYISILLLSIHLK